MANVDSPYVGLHGKAFWRDAVAQRHHLNLESLARPIRLNMADRVAVAGSCLSQHIGRYLRRNGAGYLDLEPRPKWMPATEAWRFDFEMLSCPYGKIYGTRQLLQLL
jgi:hypothetical protein